MKYKTLSEMQAALEKREVSSVELTLDTLAKAKALNKTLNCFITITEEHALKAAKTADERRQNGEHSPLLGIPIAHKDIFCTKGIKTSCASKMLDNFYPPYESFVSEKLNDAGMVLIGKTNLDEFAMGSSNETSFYGACHNPWDNTKVPGGSSGGSAVAVSSGIVSIATGTDTGGSIRQPASFCGVTGLKPTYGRVSRWGMIAYASSFDQAGLFAKTSEDIAKTLSAMAGFDKKDSTSLNHAVPNYVSTLNQSLEGKTIGLPRDFFNEHLNADVAKIILETKSVFESLGARVIDIELGHMKHAIACYYILAPAECASNLARFDGIRFGHRTDNASDLKSLYRNSREEGFGEEVKRRILIGNYVLSSGYYDAYYQKALKVRRLIHDDFIAAFHNVDFILGPTTPTPAFDFNVKQSPSERYLADIYTTAVNLAGLPALSMPAGFIHGLPIGAQLIGPALNEALLLNAAHCFQQTTNFHQQAPEVNAYV